MAEIILSPIFEAVFDKLASQAFKKLAPSKGIHEQLEKLESWLRQIQAVLFDAAQKEITDEFVKQWLNDLQYLAYDIDDVLDDLATEATHRELTKESGPSPSKVRKLFQNPFTSSPLSPRINKITARLQELVEQKNTLGLIVKVGRSKNMNRRLESTSLVDEPSIVGRQGDKEALLQKLLGNEPCNQNISVVPIVGLGGIGKTTLAGLLYHDEQVKDHFKLKAWVCVSDEFDVFKITKIIFQSVTGGNKEFPDLNMLQVALRESLSEKRFLLVLDDVWSVNDRDWELLARPFNVGAPGSKIMVTTRNTDVASAASLMGFGKPYPLQILSEEDAVSLFTQQALGEKNFDSHPRLKTYGEGIVKKCDGLPLALIALGRLLRTKPNEEDWKDLLNSEIWRLQKGNQIIPALRLSCHDLPAHLQQLFAYCSLFPKDYMFDKDELVLLWMAEGFLHQSAASKSTESLGREYFEELLSRSFFQLAPNEESLYVMHDLMNDLATYVAGDFFFRLDYEMKADVRKQALEKYRHMSFIRQRFGVYGKFKLFERAKSLRTLLAVSVGVKKSWQRFYLSNKVLIELLPQLPLLRILSLSQYQISEVPESIGSLKHLRYLNLSRTRITDLPEQVSNLYNLQTLLLCGCGSLEKLPRSFLKLKNLRHLDIRDTPRLNKMPLGIGELKSLRTLSKVIIEGANGFAINELKDLKDLQGRISIKKLDKVKNTREAGEANLLQKRLSELEMEWSEVFDGSRNETLEKEVLNVLKPHNDNLEKLVIVSYGGIEFPSWVGDPSFHRLARVTILRCKKCTSLPPLGQLQLLKELLVEGMDGVEVVGSELLGNGSVAFPSLEILSFDNMVGWELWSTHNGDTGKVFPCLWKLCIENCPNLVKVSLEAFPHLRELRIKGCGNLVETSLGALRSLQVLDVSGFGDGVLRSLVHAASSVTKLEMEDISGLTQLQGGVIEYLGAVEDVSIKWCHDLRYLWEIEAEACKILLNLRKLYIVNCSNLVRLEEKEEDNCGSSLTSLRDVLILRCERLEHFSCPSSIEKLSINWCPSITCVSFPTGGQKLKMLDISYCSNLVRLGEKEEDNCGSSLTSLRQVYIMYCERLERYSCPNNIEMLRIDGCPSITSVSFQTGGQKKLKALDIISCEKLLEEESGGGGGEKTRVLLNSNMSLLESVEIWTWPNLKSLPDLSCFFLLTRLWIFNCKNLESFPDDQLPNLTSLTNLAIEDCPSMDDSFPRGIWPPNLSSLVIGGLKKPISEWGPQNFPTPSLVQLSLIGRSRDDVSGGSQLSHLLPSSLTSLEISKFEILESLSMGIQHLGSLQRLFIWKCPELRDLPETLLPSLLELNIKDCPQLKDRCGRRGSYWPLISHIPCIYIDDHICN